MAPTSDRRLTAVVVPSYQRAASCNAKTLRLLADRGVARELVHVYVQASELAAYTEGLDPGLYGELCKGGAGGLRHQRNAITRAYPDGARLVSFDDDVTDVRQRVNEKETVPVGDLGELFARGFAACDAWGATLWGIYPVLNPYFMRAGIEAGLLFCIGHTYGFVNTHARWARSTAPCKEDYERTLLRYEHDGVVVRLADVAARTALGAKGGSAAQSTNRHALNRQAVTTMMQRWPGLVRLSPRRSTTFGLEVRLANPGPRPEPDKGSRGESPAALVR